MQVPKARKTGLFAQKMPPEGGIFPLCVANAA